MARNALDGLLLAHILEHRQEAQAGLPQSCGAHASLISHLGLVEGLDNAILAETVRERGPNPK